MRACHARRAGGCLSWNLLRKGRITGNTHVPKGIEHGASVCAHAVWSVRSGERGHRPPATNTVACSLIDPRCPIARNRPNADCAQVPGYTLMTGVDHDGDNLLCWQSDLPQAVSRCTSSSDCKAFNTYTVVGGAGWACTKRVAGPTAPKAGICFYTKTDSGAYIRYLSLPCVRGLLAWSRVRRKEETAPLGSRG